MMVDAKAVWKAERKANLLVALMDELWDDWMEWKKVYSLADLSVELMVTLLVMTKVDLWDKVLE